MDREVGGLAGGGGSRPTTPDPRLETHPLGRREQARTDAVAVGGVGSHAVQHDATGRPLSSWERTHQNFLRVARVNQLVRAKLPRLHGHDTG